MSKPAPAPRLQDRIKELRRVPGSELRANPLNYRRHPQAQRSALAGILQKVGIAAALIARDTPEGLLLIDGHLRAEDYGDVEWPVLVLDVTEEEAELLLATLDPLAALAETDDTALAALLAGLGDEEAALASLVEEAGIIPGTGDLEVPPEPVYTPQFGVVVICRDEADQESVYKDLTERGLSCRVVVT